CRDDVRAECRAQIVERLAKRRSRMRLIQVRPEQPDQSVTSLKPSAGRQGKEGQERQRLGLREDGGAARPRTTQLVASEQRQLDPRTFGVRAHEVTEEKR